MSIFSSTYDTDLDIAVWVDQIGEPACKFHEHAATFWDPEQQITEILSDQIAAQIDAKIVKEIFESGLMMPNTTSILNKTNFQYEQSILRESDRRDQYMNRWHSRAGPVY